MNRDRHRGDQPRWLASVPDGPVSFAVSRAGRRLPRRSRIP